MMEATRGRTRDALKSGVKFFKDLPRDWKVTSLRTSANRFFYQMVLPYMSVYAKNLGASSTDLGIINSVGMGVGGLLGPFTGTLIDRMGPKKLYLVGIFLLALSYFIYAIAGSWPIIIVAMLAYWLGFETSQQGCVAICATALSKETRATAMSLCETFAMGLLGALGPIVGARLLSRFGGLDGGGIKWLFFVAVAGMVLTFVLILTQLSNRNWSGAGKTRTSFFQGLSEVFKQGRGLKRFLVITSIVYLPQGMVIPFTQVFARETKLASADVLAMMVTGFSLTPLILGVPFGKLADIIGRKRVLYITGPLFWASLVMLIAAPNPVFLVISGVLQGFYNMNMVTTMAMTFEMVPREHMGRWIGVLRFFRMEIAAIAAWVAGFVSDKFGMQYIFLAVLALDVLIRMPLLITMPETLANTEDRH